MTTQTKIVLYPKSTTNFVGQGYGILSDTYSAVTTESAEENGNINYELELTYPVDGPLASKLRDTNLIRVPVDTTSEKFQIFEIYDYLDDDAGTMTIYGQSLAYRLFNLPFENGGTITKSGTVSTVLSYAKSLVKDWPTGLNLTTNIQTTIKIEDQFNNFGDFLNRVVAMVEGEVQYDNGRWILLKKRGKDTGITLRDDKNTAGLQIKYTYDEIINKIIPAWDNPDKDAEETNKTITGAPVKSKNPFQHYTYWRGKTVKVEDQNEANSYFDKNHVDQPKITATVTPVLIDENFDDVGLFDTVKIYNHRLDYLATLQVISKQFDCLNREVVDFKVGDIERNLFVAQKNKQDELDQKIEDSADEIVRDTDAKIEESSKEDQQFALDSANGRSKNYYGDTAPDSAQEGDMWFEGALGSGDVKMYKYQNGEWVELFPEGRDEKLKEQMAKADEETEAMIKAAGFDTAEELYKKVSENGKNIVSVKANANGLQTQITNQATSTNSRFTQLSNLFDSKITSAKNSMSSQITQKVNSIKLSVNHSGLSSYLYLNGSSVELGGSNIHITGNTYIANGAIQSAAIATLDAGKIVTGSLSGVNITGTSSIMLQAGARTTNISANYGVSTTQLAVPSGWVRFGSPASPSVQFDFYGNMDVGGGRINVQSPSMLTVNGVNIEQYIKNVAGV